MSNQRTVLITGSANGIGLEIARAFAKGGYPLLLTDADKNVHHVASELPTSEPPCHAYVADLANATEIKGLAAHVEDRLSGSDILINCAGVSYALHFPHYSSPARFMAKSWSWVFHGNSASMSSTVVANVLAPV